MSTNDKASANLASKEKTIWDILVRIIHLSFLILIPTLYWSADSGNMTVHQYCGITLIVLVIVRIFWGFFGTKPSRFSSFIKSPATIFNYSKSFFKRSSKVYDTHNPMGGYMVVAMFGILLTQATLGLFSTDDIFFDGPLVDLINYDLSVELTKLHRLLFDYVLAFIAIHIAAVFWYQFYKRQPLIQAMIHGKKPTDK